MLAAFYFANIIAQPNNRINKNNTILLRGSLSGKITDALTGQVLLDATVYIIDLKTGVVADSSGFYQLDNLPFGSYLVEVRHIGYKPVIKHININAYVTENFSLHLNQFEESNVIVTGQSKATKIIHSPVPIVTVNHMYLLNNMSTNIIDAIAKVPGVSTLTTGPNISKPFIRGLGYNRILTLFDGIRQEGQQWGDEHGIEVDQYSIDRIEIVKGPSSLTYGSDALAGVVNLIPTQPALEGKIIGDITTEYQTNNGMMGGSAMLGGTKKGIEWMGRVSHKRATNYQNSIDGRVYNTGFNEINGNLSIGVHGKWGYSHINISAYNNMQEVPDGSRDSATRKFTKQITDIDTLRPIVSYNELKSYTISPLHQHIQHFRIYTTNNFTIGTGRATVNLAYQRSIRREFSHPEQARIAGLFLQLNTYSYDIKYFPHEFQGWGLTMGVNGMYQTNDVTKGTEFVVPSYRQLDIGPFLMIKKTYNNKLDISGGIRWDVRAFNNSELYAKSDPTTNFDYPVYGPDTIGANRLFNRYFHTFSGLSGSIGATYNFSHQFSAKVNISRGFRAPNISEISANGVHPGTNIYQIGNDAFKPEFSFQQDIGFTYTSKYFIATLSIFNNRINHYIFNQRLLNYAGEDSVIVPGNQTYKFQQGEVNLYGGELLVDFHPFKALHFENSLSIIYGRNKNMISQPISDSNKYVPFIPPLHGVSELRYDFSSTKGIMKNSFIKLQLAYYASQKRVYLTDNTETPTSGYTLLNAGIGTGFISKKGKTIFNVLVLVNNAFDIAYQDHLSRLKYFEPYSNDPRGKSGIYNIGRNFNIKINIPIDQKM